MKKTLLPLAAVALGISNIAWAADLRLGIVGTDTSHVIDFAKLLNDSSSPDYVPGARIVAAYKGGSPDIPASRDRVEKFAAELQQKFAVRIVPSIGELCRLVDGVLLESVDGRVHLAQVREIVAARKPLFIDKPLAATLEDAREIARVAKQAGVPWFSTSTLRYAVAGLKTPNLTGAEVWGPGPLEEHHALDLSYYAIHATEMLFTVMGEGCEEVTRVHSDDTDVVACRWKDGRIGTVRALRPYSTFGAVVFHKEANGQSAEVSTPRPAPELLMRDVVKFFGSRERPVPNSETLEIFAFLDAAQRSLAASGKPMRLQ